MLSLWKTLSLNSPLDRKNSRKQLMRWKPSTQGPQISTDCDIGHIRVPVQLCRGRCGMCPLCPSLAAGSVDNWQLTAESLFCALLLLKESCFPPSMPPLQEISGAAKADGCWWRGTEAWLPCLHPRCFWGDILAELPKRYTEVPFVTASQVGLSFCLIFLPSLPSTFIPRSLLSLLSVNLCLRVCFMGDWTCNSPGVRNKQYLGQHQPTELSAGMEMLHSCAIQYGSH